MSKKFFTPIEMEGNEIKEVKHVELQNEAISNMQVVPKQQAETISATAVQAQIIGNAGSALSSNMFSAEYMNTALSTKQPNMSIHADSQAYLELVNGTEIKLKDLGIVSNYKDVSNTTLAEFIADSTFNGNGTLSIGGQDLDANTYIFLENAASPQEKAYIYLGTNNGDSSDFVSFSIDYNDATIRTFFSASGLGLSYDVNTGIYSLVIGNGAGELGSHSIPVDGSLFNTVNGSTVLGLLQSLEAYIEQVDLNATGGAATISTRLTSLSGVAGNNLQSFTEGLFTDASSIKVVLQEAETLIKASQDEDIAIRAAFAAADTGLQNNINNEASARSLADIGLQANIDAEAGLRLAGDASLNAIIAGEQSARIAGDDAIDVRLDIIEGSSAGSVAKAEADAKIYADAAVLVEKTRAEVAEAALDLKIDNLSKGDIQLVGKVQADGRVSINAARVAAGDTRNNSFLKDIAVVVGEVFVAEADVTISYDGGSSSILQNGDQLLCLEAASAGALKAGDFNQTQADESALSIANLDDLRIEKTVGGKLDIVADSIGRVQLDSAIEADIDDKQSLTQANVISSDGDTHFVLSSDLGAQQNIYYKREQLGNGPLTGTARTELSELLVHSNGSGNPFAPSYAHTKTISSHYKGTSIDFSMIMGGLNAEANAKAGTAIQATGIYASAMQPQLGINVGVTAIANGAATSNVGAVAFAGTAGAGNDRGLVASVSTTDIVNYSGARQVDPFPFADIAGVFDAKYGPAGCMALYSYGDVKFDSGKVEVEDAPSTDKGVMRLQDVKDMEKIFEMDLSNGVEKLVPCTLDLNKCLIQVIDNDESIEVQVVRDVANSQLKVKAIGGNLTAVRVIVKELNCDITSV